jgi:hypothetical protein
MKKRGLSWADSSGCEDEGKCEDGDGGIENGMIDVGIIKCSHIYRV